MTVKIKIGYEIVMRHPQDTPISFLLNLHPSRSLDLLSPDGMKVLPEISVVQFIDHFGNICSRVIAPGPDNVQDGRNNFRSWHVRCL
jgi:hypothetical protein